MSKTSYEIPGGPAFSPAYGGFYMSMADCPGAYGSLLSLGPCSGNYLIICNNNFSGVLTFIFNYAFNTGLSGDPDTGIITINQAGIYRISAWVALHRDANNESAFLSLFKNGTRIIPSTVRKHTYAGIVDEKLHSSFLEQFSAGDTLDARLTSLTNADTPDVSNFNLSINQIA